MGGEVIPASTTAQLKAEVYALLGGACVACGEDDPDKLVIDHAHDDGAQERRTKQRGGPGYYRRLLGEAGRVGKRLLCAGCNQKKELQRRRDSGKRHVPLAPNKKQIRLTVLEDRSDYLEVIAHERGCSSGEAFDQIVFEHQQLHRCLRAIEEGIEYLVRVTPPPSTLPSKETPENSMSQVVRDGIPPAATGMTWWQLAAEKFALGKKASS